MKKANAANIRLLGDRTLGLHASKTGSGSLRNL